MKAVQVSGVLEEFCMAQIQCVCKECMFGYNSNKGDSVFLSMLHSHGTPEVFICLWKESLSAQSLTLQHLLSTWRKLAEGSCPFGACQNIYLHTVDHPDVEHDKCSVPPCTGVTWERDKGGEAAPIRSLWMDLHKEHLWAVQQIHTFSGSSHHKWISGLTWQSHIIKTYLHARYPRSALY